MAADAAGLTVASTPQPQEEANSMVAAAIDRLTADVFRLCCFFSGAIGRSEVCVSFRVVAIIVFVEIDLEVDVEVLFLILLKMNNCSAAVIGRCAMLDGTMSNCQVKIVKYMYK